MPESDPSPFEHIKPNKFVGYLDIARGVAHVAFHFIFDQFWAEPRLAASDHYRPEDPKPTEVVSHADDGRRQKLVCVITDGHIYNWHRIDLPPTDSEGQSLERGRDA